MINPAGPGNTHHDTNRVVIIDALPLVRYGLRALCEASPNLRCVASVPATDAGWAAILRHRPRLVLLDSALDPKVRLITDISNTLADTAVVVLLRREQQKAQYLLAARRAGNATTLPRETDPSGLLATLQQTLRHRGASEPHPPEELPTRDTAGRPTLSPRQREVLILVARGHDNHVIAQHLHVSAETVRTHVKAILIRLGAHNRTHAVTLAYHLGLLTTDIRGQPTTGDSRP